MFELMVNNNKIIQFKSGFKSIIDLTFNRLNVFNHRPMLRISSLFLGGILFLSILSFTFTAPNSDFKALMSPSDSMDQTGGVCEHEQFDYYYTSSDRFRQYRDSVYSSMFTAENRPDKKVFDYALKGYAALLSRDLAIKKHILAFIDYSVSSNKKRFWVVNLQSLRVLYHELVAHGRNSGEEYARKFSNKENSFQSSLGFFITGELYQGKHELSIRMNGLEKSFNGKALDRGIVIHGADYVDERYIRENKRLGRSLGCPAVSERVIGKLSSVISNGVVLFSYFPNKQYLKSSKLINRDVVFSHPVPAKG